MAPSNRLRVGAATYRLGLGDGLLGRRFDTGCFAAAGAALRGIRVIGKDTAAWPPADRHTGTRAIRSMQG
jgi:hypothetical protein